MKNVDFPVRYVSLPEGSHGKIWFKYSDDIWWECFIKKNI